MTDPTGNALRAAGISQKNSVAMKTDHLTPWKPGQSGNPAGRPKSKPFKEALLRALAEAGDDKKRLGLVATALFAKACEGDVPAIKEIADRLDGKVAQTIENGDDGAFQILQTIERVIVRPKDANPDG